MLAVPRNAINLRSAGGSQLEILGYIRFMLTIGDTKFHTNNSSRSAPSGYSSCGYQCRVGASVSNQEMLHVTTTWNGSTCRKINGPAETTVALIENRTTTAEDVCSPDVPKAFHRLVIARTVCHWSAPVNKTAMVQMANPSSRCLIRRTSQCELQEVKTQFRKWDRRPVTNSVARPERWKPGCPSSTRSPM